MDIGDAVAPELDFLEWRYEGEVMWVLEDFNLL